MPFDALMAERLRELGNGFNLPAVQQLYEALLARQSRDGVRLSADQAYGAHERHRLDVYAPAELIGHAPVLVWLHGGGFIRGDKGSRANIGYWGAREGFVTVLPNYRLAPQSTWPSGPEDVVAIWQWLQREAASFGGDKRRIVLAGESAGAAHVAAACLMKRFQPDGWHLAGAALFSGPYNARLENLARPQFGVPTPDPRNDAYFSTDSAVLDDASIADRVDAAPFPLWISYAERDLVQMQVQAGDLFARLVSRHGFAPELHCVREHNHFSGGFSFGTEDTSVSVPFADFVRRVCEV